MEVYLNHQLKGQSINIIALDLLSRMQQKKFFGGAAPRALPTATNRFLAEKCPGFARRICWCGRGRPARKLRRPSLRVEMGTEGGTLRSNWWPATEMISENLTPDKTDKTKIYNGDAGKIKYYGHDGRRS